MIRLIVTDLDGTYICSSQISSENKRAAEYAQQKGVKVMACTGRTWAMCDWLIPTMGFDDFCVTSNGASIVHTETGEIVWRRRLDPNWLPVLFKVGMQSGRPFDVYCGPFIHTYTPQRSQWTLLSQERAKSLPKGHETKLRHFDTFDSWLAATRDVAELFRVEVEPGEPYPEEFAKAVSDYSMGDNITMSFKDHYDLGHPQATKQNAIDFICQRLGFERSEVMALGDSENDIGMIKYAGLGVAMGDASEAVKQVAKVVSPACADNGFAWAVEKFVLNHGNGNA
jgi:Cof subfamily protein (haloacid dehalogenase superfamily)